MALFTSIMKNITVINEFASILETNWCIDIKVVDIAFITTFTKLYL